MHEIVYHSLTKCDADIKSHLTQNIVLTGGNASLPGCLERLNKEVNVMQPNNVKTHIACPAEKSFATWIGGSILSSFHTF